MGQRKQRTRLRWVICGIIAVAVVALGLGLGLGLGLNNESSIPVPPVRKDECTSYVPNNIKRRAVTRCSLRCPTEQKCPSNIDPPVIVISLDGFRAEYLLRNMTPTMQKLSECGVHAKYMRATYPTKTFPNHYTLATGLYAESHGIIDNAFYDPDFNEVFSYGGRNYSDNRWWLGEPIWNTAMKQNKKANVLMWTGSDVNIQGMRPNECYNFNGSMPFEDRVAQVLDWFTGDPSTFPNLVLMYLEQPDAMGHAEGPYGDRIQSTLRNVDDLVNQLICGLQQEQEMDLCANIVLLADHGMAPIDLCKRAVDLSQYIDSSKYTIFDGVHVRMSSSYLYKSFTNVTVIDKPVPVEDTLSQLACRNYNNTRDWYTHAMTKQDLPKRYHYARSKRIEDIVMEVSDEYFVSKPVAVGIRHTDLTKQDLLKRYHYARSKRIEDIVMEVSDEYFVSKNLSSISKSSCIGGQHGYDNAYKSMHALFIASGPSFKANLVVDGFDNIEVYNLIAEVLGIEPAANNGTFGKLSHILKSPSELKNDMTTFEAAECRYPESESDIHARRNVSDCSCAAFMMYFNTSVEQADSRLNMSDNDAAISTKTHLPLGVPSATKDKNICHLIQEDYILGFSSDYNVPLWAAFRLLPGTESALENVRFDKVKANCSRVDVRLHNSTSCSSYSNKIDEIVESYLYNPGFHNEDDSSVDSYISSNIVPMYQRFRQGVWRDAMIRLEEYAEKFKSINVIVGPIFDYNYDGLDDSFQQISKFVDNKIPIPTHYFIIATYCNDTTWDTDSCVNSISVMSLILPHTKLNSDCMIQQNFLKHLFLKHNTARVRDIELLTGLIFFNRLSSKIRVDVSTYLSVDLWPRLSWIDVVENATECPSVIEEAVCPASYKDRQSPLILISLDGYRPDYLDRNRMPTLQRLHKCGITSHHMKSVYPSLTFPNHHSIVTGLYPESHGIVDNSMYDLSLNESFYLSSDTKLNPKWWHGEPIWNTLVRNNKTVMTYHWPGNEVEIGGFSDNLKKISVGREGIQASSSVIAYAKVVSELRKMLDAQLSSREQLSWTAEARFFHLRRLRSARPLLSQDGLRPTDYRAYDGSAPYSLQVDTAIGWLNGSFKDTFPDMILLYFSSIDSAGHEAGPHSLLVDHTLEQVDERLQQLMDGLYRLKLHKCANIIFVSDHGMSDMSCDRSVLVGPFLPDEMMSNIYMYSGAAGRISTKYSFRNGQYHAIPAAQQVPISNITSALDCVSSNMIAYETKMMPRQYHFSNNDRIDDIQLLMADTWLSDRYTPWCPIKGMHGWDARYESMKALFIGYGPAFLEQVTVPPFENIELYNLMAWLTNVSAASNNGTEGSLYNLLKYSPVPNITKSSTDYELSKYPETEAEYDRRVNSTSKECRCYMDTDELVMSYDIKLNESESNAPALQARHVPFGLPYHNTPLYLLHHNDFVSAYSNELMMPAWIAFNISFSQIKTPLKRANCSRIDVRLDSNALQPNCSIYEHLDEIAPVHLFPPEWSKDANSSSETLLHTNVVPMLPNFLTDIWAKMMNYIQDVANTTDKLHIVMGPVFDYDADGVRDLNISLSTQTRLFLPSHFFVILTRYDESNEPSVLSFVLPQMFPPNSLRCLTMPLFLKQNTARVRDVELLTGLQFFTGQEHISSQKSVNIRLSVPDEIW